MARRGAVDASPVHGSRRELRPLALREVRNAADAQLVNGLARQVHCLGCVQPVGEHLKYLVTAQGHLGPMRSATSLSVPR